MTPPVDPTGRAAALCGLVVALAACGAEAPAGAPGSTPSAAEAGDGGEGSERAAQPADEDLGAELDRFAHRSPHASTDFDLPFESLDDPRIDALGRVVEDVALRTTDGEETALLAGRDAPWLVVAFTQVGCPIALRYGPELAALHAEFAPRGVEFVGVDASPQDDAAEIEAQREKLATPFPVLEDDAQALPRALDVRTTTEVLVLDAERRLRYRGGVSDRLDVGVVRPEGEREHLRLALEALLAGGAPPLQVTEAPGCVLTRLPESEEALELPERVTYHEHAASVIHENCTPCHRPGQVAPFALQTYDDAFGWSAMIEQVVADGLMPPWPVPRRFDGDFANERGLSAREAALLLRWIEQGAPEGDPALATPPPRWPGGWSLDGIDLVVEVDEQLEFGKRGLIRTPLPPEGFYVPRDRSLEYQDLSASYVFREETWVTGVEVLAEAPTVVHHIGVFTLPADGRRRRPRGSGQDEEVLDLGEGYFGLYAPGATAVEYPPGAAKRIPANSVLRFQVHYTTDGGEHYDRPRIALRLADGPPAYEIRTGSAGNYDFSLEPGGADQFVRASMTIPVDATLITIMPHMHYRGEHFRFMLREPNGCYRMLLSQPFDFNWQMEYRLATPLPVAAGSAIVCLGEFDNSAGNPWNPDPEATVDFGRQSWDEMFFGYFDYAVPRVDHLPRDAGGGR